VASTSPAISVVVPAYNEAAGLAATLELVERAAAVLLQRDGSRAEIIVVDNASTDDTAALAARHHAQVVHESIRNIGRARNVGARASHGRTILFMDADTRLSPDSLVRMVEEMRDERSAGGTPDVRYPTPRRWLVRVYLEGWRFVGNLAGMAQGHAQFCRRDLFEELGGYDESIFVGEDVDFFWRLRKLARRRSMRMAMIRDVTVFTSSRRFDQWPLWRILLWTNPLFVLVFRRHRWAWHGWLTTPVR